MYVIPSASLLWHHNECDGVSNHRRIDCLLSRLFRRRSNKTSKLRVTGFCAGNSPMTGEFPAQRASNAENVAIGWCHHVTLNYWQNVSQYCYRCFIQKAPFGYICAWLPFLYLNNQTWFTIYVCRCVKDVDQNTCVWCILDMNILIQIILHRYWYIINR